MSLSGPQGLLTYTPVYSINSNVLPQQSTGSILLSAAAGDGLGQVPDLLQGVRGDGRRVSFPLPHPCHHMT